MRRALHIVLLFGLVCLGLVPVLNYYFQFNWQGADYSNLLWVNFVAWTLIATLLWARWHLEFHTRDLVEELGLSAAFKPLEQIVKELIIELNRKNAAFGAQAVEGKISNKADLSAALERLVALAYRLMTAESAELALFDREAGVFHSSFVMGKPFRNGAQAMLAMEEGKSSELTHSPDVIVQPIVFSGAILGSLRVALQKGSSPSDSDRDIMHMLALQAGLAIVNAQYTQELMRLKRHSEESVKAKTGFLANLSHEIRGPLGIMLNSVELVLDKLCGPVNPDQLEMLSMVKQNGDHLLELINDVLDYAKSEAGKIVAQKIEIEANELLKSVVQVVRSQADLKKHKLKFTALNEPLAFSCDKRHARQILINMLTNAIKYTPEGGTIEVWAERFATNKVRLHVKDSGVGISLQEQYKVFTAFERVEHAYSMSQKGTGLGMPLSQRLAEVNGGLIDFSSVPDKGSDFWLQFSTVPYSPLGKSSEEPQKNFAVRGVGDKILIVEHDEGERKMLQRAFNSCGFEAQVSKDTAQAAKSIREDKPALVILDNASIDLDGGGLLAALRAKKGHLPVLLLSSRAFVFDIEKYLRQGVDRCLTKPVEIKELMRICKDLIDAEKGPS